MCNTEEALMLGWKKQQPELPMESESFLADRLGVLAVVDKLSSVLLANLARFCELHCPVHQVHQVLDRFVVFVDVPQISCLF